MKRNVLTYLVFFCSMAFGQTTKVFDEKLISTLTELDLNSTDKRGIKISGIVYYVSTDNQALIAIKDDKILWQTNIIQTSGTPEIGKPEIRHIKFQSGSIDVTFGKHDFATIDVKTGKAKCLGSD